MKNPINSTSLKMNCGRSELLTYHLMLKALVQYQDSSLQYLDLLKDLAKVLNIP